LILRSCLASHDHPATPPTGSELLGYPFVARVLFAAPSVIPGWLFDLQLKSLRRDRVQEFGRAAPPLPLENPWRRRRRRAPTSMTTRARASGNKGNGGDGLRPPAKIGRSPVPDELYLDGLRKLVEENGGVVPSIPEVAR